MWKDLLQKVFISGEFQLREGEIRLFKQRAQIVPSHYFTCALHGAEDFSKEGQRQYEMMREANKEGLFKPLLEKRKVEDPLELINLGISLRE